MHHIKVTFDKIMYALSEILREEPALLHTKRRPGPKHRFTDIDIIVLSLTADSLGLNSENYLFASLESDYKNDFPTLISRRQFNDRRKRLKDTINRLRELVSNKMNKQRMTQDIYVVDSMPLRICRVSRNHWSTICKEDPKLTPKISWCAAHEEWYYGFKLNLICTGEGVVKAFQVDESTRDDRYYLDDVAPKFKGCRIVGDKGYINQMLKKFLLEEYRIHLETPYKINQKNKKPFIYGKVRKRVETVFSQLNDQFEMQRNYAKTLKGYLTRVFSKICAFTTLQYINKSKEKPIGQVQYALM